MGDAPAPAVEKVLTVSLLNPSIFTKARPGVWLWRHYAVDSSMEPVGCDPFGGIESNPAGDRAGHGFPPMPKVRCQRPTICPPGRPQIGPAWHNRIAAARDGGLSTGLPH